MVRRDRKGLAKLLEHKGIEFAIFELIQNSWDEKDVTEVNVTLSAGNKPGFAKLAVMDNAPEGFKDLRHAYTLFAESAKKGNPDQRGRFNIGEKMVLSLCKWAVITTTKGSVVFDTRVAVRPRTAAVRHDLRGTDRMTQVASRAGHRGSEAFDPTAQHQDDVQR